MEDLRMAYLMRGNTDPFIARPARRSRPSPAAWSSARRVMTENLPGDHPSSCELAGGGGCPLGFSSA